MKKFADGSFVFTGTSCTHSLIHTHTYGHLWNNRSKRAKCEKGGEGREFWRVGREHSIHCIENWRGACKETHTKHTGIHKECKRTWIGTSGSMLMFYIASYFSCRVTFATTPSVLLYFVLITPSSVWTVSLQK